MNKQKRKFNKMIKARKRHLRKVKSGMANHSFGNHLALVEKQNLKK